MKKLEAEKRQLAKKEAERQLRRQAKSRNSANKAAMKAQRVQKEKKTQLQKKMEGYDEDRQRKINSRRRKWYIG